MPGVCFGGVPGSRELKSPEICRIRAMSRGRPLSQGGLSAHAATESVGQMSTNENMNKVSKLPTAAEVLTCRGVSYIVPQCETYLFEWMVGSLQVCDIELAKCWPVVRERTPTRLIPQRVVGGFEDKYSAFTFAQTLEAVYGEGTLSLRKTPTGWEIRNRT